MIRLQIFSHQSSRYERPNQPWICGWAEIGQPCRIGPDRHGRCQATFECEPQRKGDRWECMRPPAAGGRCSEGPLPGGGCSHAIPRCSPVRSQRSRRGQVVRLSLAAVLGLLAVLVGGKGAQWFIEPGQLSAGHSGIRQCSACHASFAAGPIGWLHAAFVHTTAGAAAKPCLTCHEIGAHPLAAHGLESAALARLRRALVPPAAATPAALTLPVIARSPLRCTECHREHRGIAANLTSVSNAVCQTCHLLKFASLANGHPNFGSYPFRRRTRIIFDHFAHFNRTKNAVTTRCTACHAIDQAGQAMVVKPFSAACSSCHLDDIRGKEAVGDKGVAVFDVPALDLDTLRQRGAAIGEWPQQAESPPTQFMRLLLSRNPAIATDFATIGTMPLDDLHAATAKQIAAVERIAWAIKELLFDLSIKGPVVIARTVGGKGESTPASADLIAGLPPEAVRTAENDWFPNLADEVVRHRAGKPVPMKGAANAKQGLAPPAAAASGAPGTAPAAGNTPILGGGSSASILGGGPGGSILGGGAAQQPAAPQAAAKPSPAGGGPGGSILGGPGGSILGGGSQGSILGGGAAQQPAPPAAPQAAPKPQPVGGEAWAALGGGWYRSYYTLYYRPAGHYDPFLRAWLDLTGRRAQNPQRPAAGLFKSLAQPTAPGECGKCHSVDRRPDGGLLVNWMPYRAYPDEHAFTKFLHRPHLNLFGASSCKDCHQLDAKAHYAASYRQDNPLNFTAAFAPISRKLCAGCHVAGRAPTNCVTCHDYHIGHLPQAAGVTTAGIGGLTPMLAQDRLQ